MDEDGRSLARCCSLDDIRFVNSCDFLSFTFFSQFEGKTSHFREDFARVITERQMSFRPRLEKIFFPMTLQTFEHTWN